MQSELSIKELKNELAIKELVRFCTVAYFDKFGVGISETKLLKFLSKATTTVSKNNPLHHSIPFYWYIDGPCSPPLQTLYKQLLKDDILQLKGVQFVASSQKLCPHDESFQEICHLLTEMIITSVSETSETDIDNIYECETSYNFYITFKFKFINALKSYLYDSNSKFNHADLEKILYNAISELPFTSLFSKFRREYRDFIHIMIRITKLELTEKSKIDIEKITKSVFETFAKGIRTSYHDPYFEYLVEDWETQFENSINEMEQNIDKLHDLSVSLGSKDNTLLTISEIIEIIQNLKHTNKLDMVTFIPGKLNRELNHGKFDATFFDAMNDDEFESLLRKFTDSRNVVVHYGELVMKSTLYRLRHN